MKSIFPLAQFAVLIVVVLAGTSTRAVADDQLSGVWHGTGADERLTLIFTGKVMISTLGNHPLVGTVESGFQAERGDIDIERADGTQRGVYTIDSVTMDGVTLKSDTLKLTVAGVNQERPVSVGEKPRHKFRTYTFTRQR